MRIVTDDEEPVLPTDAQIFDDGNWFAEAAWIIWYAHRLGVDCAVLSPTGETDGEPWRALRQTCIPERTALVLHDQRERFRQRRHLQLAFEESAATPTRDAETGYWLGWQELLAALPGVTVERGVDWDDPATVRPEVSIMIDADDDEFNPFAEFFRRGR